jgi:hypothetical protein
MSRLLVLLTILAAPCVARAGLHYSGEKIADLPSRWGGFLLDQRALRLIAVPEMKGKPATLLRQIYQKEAARLAGLKRDLTADEAADLGAIYVRLGQTTKAIDVLRPASRKHPLDFRIAANLGTAWQMDGNLRQAAASLEQAVRLAPGKFVRAEALHLRLVRLRLKEKADVQGLDNLFGVVWLPATPERVKKLPAGAIAQAQQLALWLPADARLLWQLGELAGAHGDVVTQAAVLDGCVVEFAMRHPDLLAHRKTARAAAEKVRITKKEHEGHAWLFKPRSSRPLIRKTGLDKLPPIDARKPTALPWDVIAETTLDRKTRPTFHRYLKELDGKKVKMEGYMQPIGPGGLGSFLIIENPVGCWYCEMPEITGMVLVEMPDGKVGKYTRSRLRVTGTLSLNSTDAENFLYTVKDAKTETLGE